MALPHCASGGEGVPLLDPLRLSMLYAYGCQVPGPHSKSVAEINRMQTCVACGGASC